MSNLLVVQCKRDDLSTDYVQLGYDPDEGLRMDYFSRDDPNEIKHNEFYPFDEYAELRLLRDGLAWNINELRCWIRAIEMEGEEQSRAIATGGNDELPF